LDNAANHDDLWGWILRAELLFLDGDAQSSLRIFREKLASAQDGDFDVALVIADNRSTVAGMAFDPDSTREFYSSVDEHKIRKVSLWNESEILSADYYAARGKHYDALPKYWVEVLKANAKGYWRGRWWASERMAQECLVLNSLKDATFHAIFGLSKDCTKPIIEYLLQTQDPAKISETVRIVIQCGALTRLASLGMEILEQITDIIPDEDIPEVADWVLTWARRSNFPSTLVQCPRSAWNTLGNLASRLDATHIDMVLVAAREHPAWKSENSVVREQIVAAAGAAIEFASTESCEAMIESTLYLVEEGRSHIDFTESLNLVCRLYPKVGENSRELIFSSLFPPGLPQSDPRKLQVAALLGKKIGDEQQWTRSALQVGEMIRLQVQYLPKDVEAKTLPGNFGIYQSGSPTDETKLVVQIAGTMYLDALVLHRAMISNAGVLDLIDAACAMLTERENTIANKFHLVKLIRDFADVIPPETMSKVTEVLMPIYLGDVPEPKRGMTYAESVHPLNPFKMGMGDPRALRGMAIQAAAEIFQLHPEFTPVEFETHIFELTTDIDSKIRASALAASKRWLSTSESMLTALIMCARDPDTNTVIQALDALTRRDSGAFNNFTWRSLVFALRMALQSKDIDLRVSASYSISHLLRQSLDQDTESALRGLQDIASRDVSHSVRFHAKSVPLSA
jgi:hypothetical protein